MTMHWRVMSNWKFLSISILFLVGSLQYAHSESSTQTSNIHFFKKNYVEQREDKSLFAETTWKLPKVSDDEFLKNQDRSNLDPTVLLMKIDWKGEIEWISTLRSSSNKKLDFDVAGKYMELKKIPMPLPEKVVDDMGYLIVTHNYK